MGTQRPQPTTSNHSSHPSTTANMGKVHGSLARAGKVKSQTPKVEPQEKKKTPKGRKEENHVHPPFRERHHDRWQEKDEPQPYLVNEFRIWSLRDGAKTGTWIAHSLATPSIHHWAARPFPSPGNYDDDSKPWRTCMANQLLFVSRNKCRRRDWCTSGVFGSFFATTVTS